MVTVMVVNALRWTIQDLESMPDDGGWKRHEIIDGELYVTRAPHISHQNAGGKLYFFLEAWSQQTKLGQPIQSPGVIFTVNDAVIPDVAWVSNDRLANHVDEGGHLTIAPEIMVKVLSPGEQNENRDKKLKLKLYSRYGVQEYWVVNWQLKTLEVYRRDNAQRQLVQTLMLGDNLTSPLLPGFSVTLKQLFP